jgi:hypothetical protein
MKGVFWEKIQQLVPISLVQSPKVAEPATAAETVVLAIAVDTASVTLLLQRRWQI